MTDRLWDMVLFAMAGGLIAGLSYMGVLKNGEPGTLTSVLIGAVAMYLKSHQGVK